MMNNFNHGRPRDYNKDINVILAIGLLLRFVGISLWIFSIGFHFLWPNPYGIIALLPCPPGPYAILSLVNSFVFSICAPYLAALLANSIKAILSSTSIHEIVVHAWMLLSKAILLFGYVCFWITMVYSLQLIFCTVHCTTDSKSSGLAIMLAVLLSLVLTLSRQVKMMKRFNNGIIIAGMLLGSLSMSLLMISLVFGDLGPSPYGVIAASPSCIPDSQVADEFIYSFVLSICAPFLASLLAIGLKATLSFTRLHEIAVRAWVLVSAAMLFIGYVFCNRVLDTLELILASDSCATDSKNIRLAAMLGVGMLFCFVLLFMTYRFPVPR